MPAGLVTIRLLPVQGAQGGGAAAGSQRPLESVAQRFGIHAGRRRCPQSLQSSRQAQAKPPVEFRACKRKIDVGRQINQKETIVACRPGRVARGTDRPGGRVTAKLSWYFGVAGYPKMNIVPVALITLVMLTSLGSWHQSSRSMARFSIAVRAGARSLRRRDDQIVTVHAVGDQRAGGRRLAGERAAQRPWRTVMSGPSQRPSSPVRVRPDELERQCQRTSSLDLKLPPVR